MAISVLLNPGGLLLRAFSEGSDETPTAKLALEVVKFFISQYHFPVLKPIELQPYHLTLPSVAPAIAKFPSS